MADRLGTGFSRNWASGQIFSQHLASTDVRTGGTRLKRGRKRRDEGLQEGLECPPVTILIRIRAGAKRI
jgi:hypothetical protein